LANAGQDFLTAAKREFLVETELEATGEFFKYIVQKTYEVNRMINHRKNAANKMMNAANKVYSYRINAVNIF